MLFHSAHLLWLYCLPWVWAKVHSEVKQVVWRDREARSTNGHQRAPKIPQSHCAVAWRSEMRLTADTDVIYYGGIKERPPWKDRCPRMGTEDEAQRDGGREWGRMGKSPISGILNRSLPAAAASRTWAEDRRWRKAQVKNKRAHGMKAKQRPGSWDAKNRAIRGKGQLCYLKLCVYERWRQWCDEKQRGIRGRGLRGGMKGMKDKGWRIYKWLPIPRGKSWMRMYADWMQTTKSQPAAFLWFDSIYYVYTAHVTSRTAAACVKQGGEQLLAWVTLKRHQCQRESSLCINLLEKSNILSFTYLEL